MRFPRLAAAACLPLLLAACAATGPKFAEVESSLPQLRSGEGRIFFFRESTPAGAALRPDVRLNGEVVGAPTPGSFFFVDRPAGRYTADARTESESTVQFELSAGESAYVSLQINMGILVGRPQLIVHAPISGAVALAGLAYIGNIPLVPGSAGPVNAGRVRPGATPGSEPPPVRQGKVTMEDLRGLLPAKP